MDETPALDQYLSSWYQYLIGMLRWMVKIGREDIITEVSMMPSYMAMLREVLLLYFHVPLSNTGY